MRRFTLVSTTALGIVIGATVLHGLPATAQTATINVAPITQQNRSFAQETGLGIQPPSVPLTTIQTQLPQNVGRPAQTSGSLPRALQTEAERRISDATWSASLQDMAPASVQREIASEMAMNNYLLFQTYKMQMMLAAINAGHVAENTERRLRRHRHGISDRHGPPNPGQRPVAGETPGAQRGSCWVPGWCRVRHAIRPAMRAPSRALPRRRALCTNWKKPR
jgi:hypothetical protein